jgi:effector-binding domain-containing protein
MSFKKKLSNLSSNTLLSEAIVFRKTLIFGLPILLVLLIFYYYLGGFKDTQLSLVETDSYVVAGYEYIGLYKEEALQDLFFQVSDLVDSGKLAGTVTVVNYQFQDLKRDSVHQLIGVQLSELPSAMPEGMSVDTIPASCAVRAIIQAHPLVMPHPEETQQRIIDFAQDQSLELNSMVLERYIGQEKIWVDIPVR